MKNNTFLRIALLAFVVLYGLSLSAQGLRIWKKDGQQIDVPRELLDSVTVYEYTHYDSIEAYHNKLTLAMGVMKQYTSNGQHTDFGVPAISLFTECSGQDMVSEDHGYNWFNPSLKFQDRGPKAQPNNFIWQTYYKQIDEVNNCLREWINDKNYIEGAAFYKGQALALRAFDYLQLIQLYQFTYLGHENASGVPLVDEKTTEEMKKNNPRRTVKEVYDFIMKDLDNAIQLLTGQENPYYHRTYIRLGTVYGLRARANMLTGNYRQAAIDADSALIISRATPLTIEQASVPGFTDVNSNSWLWGIEITPEDDVAKTAIVTWPSHLCSFTLNGYTTGAGVTDVLKRINSSLYAKMDESDVRRGWWIDPQTHDSPLPMNAWNVTCEQYAQNAHFGFSYPDYTNMKFGIVDDYVYYPENSQDWPLMRAEEMLLIKAEAVGRTQSVEAGKRVLEAFLKEFRAPAYQCKAQTEEEFIDEIFNQRRIELWGEGFSLQDVLRFKKPIVRSNSNFTENLVLDLEAEAPLLLYNIPECETNVNKGIGDDINEVVKSPLL